MSDARAGQRGYILALLLGMATVMGILLLKAIPTVRSEVQRDAEEELIFRGECLAKGIRLYRARTGAYPMELEDLLKQRPAVVRRLYRDPLNPTGEWDLVTAVQPGPGGDTRGLPIVGVRSRVGIDAFKSYQGKTLTSDWVFSAADDLLGVPGGAGAGAPGQMPGAGGYSDATKGGGTSSPDPDKK